MKKFSLLSLLLLATAQFAWGAIITQNFDTGAIDSGSSTTIDFNVFKFDTSIGTLTRVTFEISVKTWGGAYTVINNSNLTGDDAIVKGTMFQGMSAHLTSTLSRKFCSYLWQFNIVRTRLH